MHQSFRGIIAHCRPQTSVENRFSSAFAELGKARRNTTERKARARRILPWSANYPGSCLTCSRMHLTQIGVEITHIDDANRAWIIRLTGPNTSHSFIPRTNPQVSPPAMKARV